MEIVLLVFLVLNLALLFLLYGKIRKIHLFCWRLKDEISDHAVHSIRNIEALDYLYRKLKFASPLPPTMGFAGSPDFLRLVADYAAQDHVSHMLECSSGLSTIVIAQALKLKGKGHLYSLENNAEYADITRNNLRQHGLEDWATVITAPLTEHALNGGKYNWYDIDGKIPELKFDGLVIDGPPWSVSPNARYPAGPLLFHRLKPAAHVFLDDYGRAEEQTCVNMWLKDHGGMRLWKHRFLKGCAELVKS